MVARLALAGVRSISLPVDITNYVMLEMGQPIHGYDLDTLSGGITVRRAAAGETLVTLDGHERTLHPEDLTITDDSGVIGLAGVMGGAKTEISDATTAVLVEAAWFEPVSIARTQRRHKLPSEASKRFARGVDPLVAEAAAELGALRAPHRPCWPGTEPAASRQASGVTLGGRLGSDRSSFLPLRVGPGQRHVR
jgi:phenylalanyl-tRNA synthetase beta chain